MVPTVLQALGVPVPSDVQGQSLLPGLRDETLERLDVAITEHERWTSVRSATHHYVVHADGHELLWDIGADAGEHRELVDEHPQDPTVRAALARHQHLLLQRQLQARRVLTRTFPY